MSTHSTSPLNDEIAIGNESNSQYIHCCQEIIDAGMFKDVFVHC
jgi:hypothetical protein